MQCTHTNTPGHASTYNVLTHTHTHTPNTYKHAHTHTHTHTHTRTLTFLLQHFSVKSIYKIKLYTSDSLMKLVANLIFKRVLVTLQKRKSPNTMGRTHLKIAPNSSKHMCTNFSRYDHIHVSNTQLHKRPLWKKHIYIPLL